MKLGRLETGFTPTHQEVMRVMVGEGDDGGLVDRAMEAYRRHARAMSGRATGGGDWGLAGTFDYWLVRQCMLEARAGLEHMVGPTAEEER